MRERARLIGAELALESRPGEGTTVRLRIPLRGQTGSLAERVTTAAVQGVGGSR
jgi:hypothetical protein